MFVTDAAGVPYDNDDALRAFRAVANAPIFAYFASQFGLGAIGGRLYQDSEVGARAAQAAIRILRGEKAESIPPQILGLAVPTYDWRELRRWGIPEARLPTGSLLRFRQPTPWELYRWRIITIVSLCLLQTGLIIVLMLNRARRRRAEQSARALSRRLIHAQEEEQARLARDLHDDVTQRLARLAIDAGRVERGVPVDSAGEVMRSVRDGLVRLCEDVHALSYRLHPSVLEDLGLAEALKAECERFSRRESIPSDVKLLDLPAVIAPDPALCLFRVAQGALHNIARHARARGVDVLLRGMDGGLQLAVHDDGVGFDPTAEKNHPTLGLASMDERVHLAGGELDIESTPGHGTTIVAWVPMKAG
jgi:signal transduction histidine kinase